MKLRIKIVIMNIITISVILVFSGYFLLRAADNSNLYSVYKYMLNQSNFCQQLLAERYQQGNLIDLKSPESRIDTLAHLKKYISCDIQLLGNNITNPTAIQKRILQGNKVYFIDSSNSTREFTLGFPVYLKEKTIGIIILKEKLFHADSMRKELQYVAIIVLLVTLLTLTVVSYLVSYRMIKPLEKLTDAARNFSRGEFKEIDGIHTRDEIELLSNDFNEMGKSIHSMIDQIKTEQQKQKDFFDNVTHEIRTPITNIIGYADLTARVPDDEDKQKYLGYINSEGNRLLNLVNDLLDLSKIKNYKLPIHKTEFQLDTLILEVQNLMHDTALKFGFSIEVMLDEISVIADRERLKQVIINLVDNSLKHSDGSRIVITLKKTHPVLLSVSDNGIGIPADKLDKLSTPFYRVERNINRKTGGNNRKSSGLGLSICSEILKVHGYSMKIDSEENYGTTVSILITESKFES